MCARLIYTFLIFFLGLPIFSNPVRAGDFTKDTYPSSFIDRPLILPPRTAQAELLVGITNASTRGVDGTGETVTAALDAGFIKNVQGGFFLTLPVHPNPDFGTFLVNLQYRINDAVNARIDLGENNLSLAFGSSTGSSAGFTFGFGFPFKVKLNSKVALIGGRSNATSFSIPMHFSNGSTSFYGLGILLSDDNFGISFNDIGKFGNVSLPVGLLVQLHDLFAIALRSGFKYAFILPDRGNDTHEEFIPIALDVMFAPLKSVDLGFTFELPGEVHNNDSSASAFSGYADIRQFNVWGRVRF